MQPVLEIFSQGEELVTGQIADTNAAWLSEQLNLMGFAVSRHTAVGDQLTELVVLLREIAVRADICICTGGLGPTTDDLTAEAVAQAFDRPLQFDALAFDQINAYFVRRNRVMPEINRKQAMLPATSIRIDNAWGTAPGFSLQLDRCWFVFLPGVPREMQQLFQESVHPYLVQRFSIAPRRLVTIKTVGVGESRLQQLIDELILPGEIALGFRACSDHVQVKLTFPTDYQASQLDNWVNHVVNTIGDSVFAVDHYGQTNRNLIEVVDQLMVVGQHTLVVAETISQGLLSAQCVGKPWLLSSRYEPSSQHLAESLGIAIADDDDNRVVESLARSIQSRTEAKLVLVQSYRGTHQALNDKDQAVTLSIGLLSQNTFRIFKQNLIGPISYKQNQAALLSLDSLRRYLQLIPVSHATVTTL